MIVIKDAELSVVLKNIDAERTFLDGLKNNIGMLQNSSSDILSGIHNYVRRNAVFNSISEKAKRSISSKHDIFQTMSFALANGIALLNDIEARLKKSNIKVFDTATITYRQKGMFDWISAINFFGKYTSSFIDVCLTQPKTVNNYLTKADFQFINKTAEYYNVVLARLCDSLSNIKRSLDLLSDETYDESESSIIENIRGKQAASIGFAPHVFNPGYWIRYRTMVKDVNTIKSSREKIDMYAMKLQRLENKRNNSEDPAIDRQIEYWQNEIQILDANIANIEAKYLD